MPVILDRWSGVAVLCARWSSRRTCGSSAAKAGDRVQFIAVDLPTARRSGDARDQESATLTPDQQDWQATAPASPIVLDTGAGDQRLVARLSGDTHLLLEVGAPNWTSSRASGRTPSCRQPCRISMASST